MKYIITAASGQLGRMVIDQLLKSETSENIGVSVQNPDKVQYLRQMGLRVRRGDYNDSDSLRYAFEGGERFLIVSPPVTGELAIRMHRAAFEQAKTAGAKRIFYTSHIGASSSSLFPPMKSHAAAEEYLQNSNTPYTTLRNGFYAESATMMLGDALKTGELRLPEDGPVAWTSHADLAEATARLLSQGEVGQESASPHLTGAEAIDFQQIAKLLSELTGHEIRRTVVTDEEYEAAMIARGVPKERLPIMTGLFRASRRGEFSKTDPTLARLIQRPTMTMRDVLRAVVSQMK